MFEEAEASSLHKPFEPGSMTTLFNGMTEAELDALASELGWLPCELVHAKATTSAGNSWGDECVVITQSGRELRSPLFPEPCSYVRVVQQGFELGYWNSDEWREAPEEVIGAVVGALNAGAESLTADVHLSRLVCVAPKV